MLPADYSELKGVLGPCPPAREGFSGLTKRELPGFTLLQKEEESSRKIGNALRTKFLSYFPMFSNLFKFLDMGDSFFTTAGT